MKYVIVRYGTSSTVSYWRFTGSRYQARVTGRVFGAISGASFSEWLLRTGCTVDRHRYILLQAKVICEFRERDWFSSLCCQTERTGTTSTSTTNGFWKSLCITRYHLSTYKQSQTNSKHVSISLSFCNFINNLTILVLKER